MSKEKKTAEIKEEIKEEIKNSAQLTDEEMAEVNAGMAIDNKLVLSTNLEVARAELAAEVAAN